MIYFFYNIYPETLSYGKGEDYLKIAICDDSLADAETLRDILVQREGNNVIDLFDSGGSFLAAADGRDYDLVFMDVFLPDGDGVEVVLELRRVSPACEVVFVTVSDSYAVAAFSLRALHYIVKPFTEGEIDEVFDRLKTARASDAPPSTLTVCFGSDVYTLPQSDILRLEAGDHRTNIYMKNGSVYSTRLSFGKVAEELDSRFLQINRGIAVNMEHIVRWGAQDCEMSDRKRFLLNRRRKQELKEAYLTYKMNRMLDRAGD